MIQISTEKFKYRVCENVTLIQLQMLSWSPGNTLCEIHRLRVFLAAATPYKQDSHMGEE